MTKSVRVTRVTHLGGYVDRNQFRRQISRNMNKEEPSLLSHLNEIRKICLPEGGISTIIICGQMNTESSSEMVLSLHRQIVEDEVNTEEVNITGLLVGQVSLLLKAYRLIFIDSTAIIVYRVTRSCICWKDLATRF
jgi:hypothetical protein